MSKHQVCDQIIDFGTITAYKQGSMYYYRLDDKPSKEITYSFIDNLKNSEYADHNVSCTGTVADYFDDIFAFPCYNIGETEYYFVCGHIPYENSDAGSTMTLPFNFGFYGWYEVHIATRNENNEYECNLNDLNTLYGTTYEHFIVQDGCHYGFGLFDLNDEINPSLTGQLVAWSHNIWNPSQQQRILRTNIQPVSIGSDIDGYNTGFQGHTMIYYAGASSGGSSNPFNLVDMNPPTGVPVSDDGSTPSGTGGGGGTYSAWGDSIDHPGVPTNSALTSNLLTMFKMTTAQLNDFSHFLYTDNFLTNVKKLFSDPFDYIINLQFLPIDTANTITIPMGVGGVGVGINAEKLTSQYVSTQEYFLSIDEYYGSFADYSPMTKIMIYLPFIGFKDISVDDCMAGRIGIKYNIDLLTGDIVCTVKVYAKYTQTVLYCLNGNCSSQAPLTGRDYATIYRSALQSFSNGVASGNVAGGAVSAMLTMALSKPNVQRGGTIAGNASLLTSYIPYLIFMRPAVSEPADFAKFNGRPSNITCKLSTLTGYTEVDRIITNGFGSATEEEVAEIKSLLESGVIF